MDIAVISVLCANAVASGVEPGFHLTGVVHATLIPRLPFGLIDARFGAYLAISALLIVTPGPDMALVTRNALRSGQRAASFTALGVAVGICTWAIASVIGIGVLLESSVIAFTVLKIAGAVYLGYLGLHNLIESFQSRRDTGTPAFFPEGKHVDDRAAFKQGVAGNVLNPKAGVIFVSIVPQFIRPGDSSVRLVLMLLAFEAILLAWLNLYGFLLVRAGRSRAGVKVRAAIERVTGVALIVLGIRVALEPR